MQSHTNCNFTGMKLRVLVFINAAAVAITVSAVNYYFKHSWYDVAVTFGLTLLISFVTFYILLEKYIYSKIKIIYKLIHNLKLSRDLRDSLGEHLLADPITDLTKYVKTQ